VLSKVFEHCILRRSESYFINSDNQFRFKNILDIHNVMHMSAVRSVVNHYTSKWYYKCVCYRYLESYWSCESFWIIGLFSTI